MLISVVPYDEQEKCYRELARSKRGRWRYRSWPLIRKTRASGFCKVSNCPFVVHGRTEESNIDYSWLDVNNRSSFKRATNFLLDLGHERIALLNGIEEMDFAYRRRLGYEAALLQRGIEVDPSLIFSSDMIEPYGYDVTKSFAPEGKCSYGSGHLLSSDGARRCESSSRMWFCKLAGISPSSPLTMSCPSCNIPAYPCSHPYGLQS